MAPPHLYSTQTEKERERGVWKWGAEREMGGEYQLILSTIIVIKNSYNFLCAFYFIVKPTLSGRNPQYTTITTSLKLDHLEK